MNDILKLLAIVCSIVVCFVYMHYALARPPTRVTISDAIIATLKASDIKPSTLGYGQISDCGLLNTQTILFTGKTIGLQRLVHGLLCCDGNACYLEKMEFDQ